MNAEISKLIQKAIEYDKGDPRRINHLLKVHSFSRTIGELEGLEAEAQRILEAAAVLHDIGIHESERKYNSATGEYQQLEGPPIARKMLDELGFEEDFIERVCFLIAHHHIYNSVDGADYQILIEADFLVNAFEDDMPEKQIQSIKNKIFKTKAGTEFLCNIFTEKYVY